MNIFCGESWLIEKKIDSNEIFYSSTPRIALSFGPFGQDFNPLTLYQGHRQGSYIHKSVRYVLVEIAFMALKAKLIMFCFYSWFWRGNLILPPTTKTRATLDISLTSA